MDWWLIAFASTSHSTLCNQQDSNLECSEAMMWEEWSLVCFFLAFQWLCGCLGWRVLLKNKTAFWGHISDNSYKMFCQQNIALTGVDDLYSRINGDQNVNDQSSKPRLWIRELCQFLRIWVQAQGGHFEHLPQLNKQTKLLAISSQKSLKIISCKK